MIKHTQQVDTDFPLSVGLQQATTEWDDSVSPARIRQVIPTRMPQSAARPTRNIAREATPSTSNEPVPVQYWTKALNDGIRREAPLPPDMWGTWRGANNPAHPWIEYRWNNPVTVDGSRIWFWADHPAGAGEGVAPPKRWRIEYWDGRWKPVPQAEGYGVAVDAAQEIRFGKVTTRCIRATFDASQAGAATAGIAVTEWEVLAPKPVRLVASGSKAAAPCDK